MTTHSTTVEKPVQKQSCCSRMKSCCKHAGRAREIGLAGMTAMATFGPKRLRPYFQQVLAVISVVTAAVQFFRARKG
ncbi:hypothetical protein [Gluconobacter morbifer]|uniref:Uncharacterized protein n=1 Tax=Gluconobacter morbifer G707 TaxID=1088869 RepID=G6XJM6_9PROT|nr:hypothetical protein [Gluconobacter morbifer]EHH67838.1 hypothetical protein GMO_16050 [Gluconobacter morbifer G707]